MNFVYTTMPRMRRLIRDKYRATRGLRHYRAARWLLNNCTNAQLQNVFNLDTIDDAIALRTRLEAKEAKLVAWEAERDALAALELAAESEVGE